jgi:hypothetical protein
MMNQDHLRSGPVQDKKINSTSYFSLLLNENPDSTSNSLANISTPVVGFIFRIAVPHQPCEWVLI